MGDIRRIGWVRAADSWDRLPEASRLALARGLVFRREWGLSFGHELGQYLTRHISDGDSAEAAVAEAWAVPNEEIDMLATKHASREVAISHAILGVADSSGAVGRGPAPARPTGGHRAPTVRLGDRVATPFDGIVDRLWGSPENITVGPFRLAGALELIGAVILGVLVWIPATLANTYRLLHGGASAGNLAKAGLGWLGIVLALAWLISPR